jgi:hypothetical protein
VDSRTIDYGINNNNPTRTSFQSLLVFNSFRDKCVRFEVFTAVTMENGIFWDVTPCDFSKNRRFGGT